jgi:two-component system chemotaxis sensor kinase CheA
VDADRLSERLLGIFVSELDEQLRALNRELLALESDPGNREGLASVFRIVHTLKGAAGAAQAGAVERVCHLLESMLARAREGTLSLGDGEFGILFRAADFLGECAERLKEGRALDEAASLELERALRGEAMVPAPASAPSAPPRADLAPSAPTPAPPAPAPLTAPSAPAVPRREKVRIESRKLDALLAASGQLRVACERISARTGKLEELHAVFSQQLAGWERTVRSVRSTGRGDAVDGSLLPAVAPLTEELERIAEEMDRLAGMARDDERALSLAVDEVTNGVRRARLRPFSDACVSLPRTVRDLASEAGREARLEIEGGEVEADRAVIDVLGEVLLHLVRNAVDHGLEAPAEREAAGKGRVGTVRVAASHEGPGLHVVVADDGRGPDLHAIRRRLAERGGPVPEDAEELIEALFQPGFSTRSEASTVSGRGVGLDAVRTALERIGGRVRVRWRESGGTTFILECPPTVSTFRALLVGLDSQIFAIPSSHIAQIVRVRSEEVRRVAGRPVILTADAPVPLVPLATVLGPPLRQREAEDAVPVVILMADGRRIAVITDELISEEEIMLRPLEHVRKPPHGIAGATLLASGRISLVLDAPAIVTAGLRYEGPLAGLTKEREEPANTKRILVVDDSITTRTLEASILQTAGYEVATAVDGEDGWRLLQGQPFDLIVSDVEMPRMDGFALCRAVRGAPHLAGTPVVLVSALESAEHRALGLEAGADAYLPKSTFDQRDLLDTIQQLVR